VTRFRLSLTATILSALSLVLLVSWLLLGVVALKITERTLYSRKANEALRLVTVLTRLVPPDITTTSDSEAATGFIRTLAQDYKFRNLLITDPVGTVVFAAPNG